MLNAVNNFKSPPPHAPNLYNMNDIPSVGRAYSMNPNWAGLLVSKNNISLSIKNKAPNEYVK